MNVARILYPVNVLGPGKRIGIWLAGCKKRCKGCSNPELWHKQLQYEISVNNLVNLIQTIAVPESIDGFTISGGEPMDQAEELYELIVALQEMSQDILVYSGYMLEELKTVNNPAIDRVLKKVTVLIDGPYVEDLNENHALKGSANQRIHILDNRYRDSYNAYLENAHNQIQNFPINNGIVSVGIHRKGFTPYT